MPEVDELLFWFEFGLTDHDIAERGEVPYHRVHRFFLNLRRAIQEFEDEAIRLLDGKVEVDETYFGASFENRRAAVAVARKLAVLLHRLWITGEVYEPLRNADEEAA